MDSQRWNWDEGGSSVESLFDSLEALSIPVKKWWPPSQLKSIRHSSSKLTPKHQVDGSLITQFKSIPALLRPSLAPIAHNVFGAMPCTFEPRLDVRLQKAHFQNLCLKRNGRHQGHRNQMKNKLYQPPEPRKIYDEIWIGFITILTYSYMKLS